MSEATGIHIYFGHPTRDPNASPRFGDVFEINTEVRIYRVMFIGMVSELPRTDWYGVQLEVTGGDPLFREVGDVSTFVPLSTDAWKFVGNCVPDGFGTFEDDL